MSWSNTESLLALISLEGAGMMKNSPQGSIKYHTVKNAFSRANRTATASWTNNEFSLVLLELLKTNSDQLASGVKY